MHVAAPPEPERLHDVNVPVPLDERITVPVGVNVGAGEVSVTVAVQLVELYTTIVVGWHENAIVTVLRVEVIALLAPLLAKCTASPP